MQVSVVVVLRWENAIPSRPGACASLYSLVRTSYLRCDFVSSAGGEKKTEAEQFEDPPLSACFSQLGVFQVVGVHALWFPAPVTCLGEHPHILEADQR